jgi:hypothetical protein
MTDYETYVTKDIKIKDIYFNDKVTTNILSFNHTISQQKIVKTLAGSGIVMFKSFYDLMKRNQK